ncbi:DR2241 family protein [Halorussus halophilus]|uniref:DR2241 family protein n=1 Tax=Halorussus halophilus TaxID=2650975 RepID=UPI001CE438A6|nr:DR2241 family protein [Halorussus halophilus]
MPPIDAPQPFAHGTESSPADTLLDALGDYSDSSASIDFDDLLVEVEDEGFRFETPDCSHSGLTRSQLHELATDSEYVNDWYYWEQAIGGHDADHREFLRWLEGDDPVPERYDSLRDGIASEWGQLQITVTLGETTPEESPRHDDEFETSQASRSSERRATNSTVSGATARRYELRHVADADAEQSTLDHYHDPLDARLLARDDSSGEYRPLKSAPTLRDGWVFPTLSVKRVVRAVQEFYPASISNWARERRGELDVTHFEATAERQTGIYALVEELGPEAVANAVTACCTDSECLKRREWEYGEDEQLDAPAGDGEIPCREPCSLFVATAREFAKVERETEQTYELTLTPSEREQLDRLVAAIADDDRPRIGDATDGANRFRARYLREKRFAGDD